MPRSRWPHQHFWAHVHALWGSGEPLTGRVLSETEQAVTGKADALEPQHLGDHLMCTEVHLEPGGGLEEFSHPGQFPDCRQKAMVDLIQAMFFRRTQRHGMALEPCRCVQFGMVDSEPTRTNPVH